MFIYVCVGLFSKREPSMVPPKFGKSFQCAFVTFKTPQEAAFVVNAVNDVVDADISPGFIKASLPLPVYCISLMWRMLGRLWYACARVAMCRYGCVQ